MWPYIKVTSFLFPKISNAVIIGDMHKTYDKAIIVIDSTHACIRYITYNALHTYSCGYCSRISYVQTRLGPNHGAKTLY